MDGKIRLMIVDDDADIVDLLKTELERFDCEVFTASNGLEGIQTVKARDIEMIISDINMPGLDGLEMLKALRLSEFLGPVILITAFGDKEKALKALRLGALDFLDKPFDFETLHSVVEKGLDISRRFRKLGSEVRQVVTHVAGNEGDIAEALDMLSSMWRVKVATAETIEAPAEKKQSTK